MLQHIHTPHDGRGIRHVYVNDRLVAHVFFADERRGIADAFRFPFKLDKHRKRPLSYRLRGAVRVVDGV